MARRKPLEQPDLMIEAREIEAISLECGGCRARVEALSGAALRDDCSCPSCGRDMRRQRETIRLLAVFMDDAGRDSTVRFRVRLLTRPKVSERS